MRVRDWSQEFRERQCMESLYLFPSNLAEMVALTFGSICHTIIRCHEVNKKCL